jgi:tetratricopeptide (TPR) repeat protein
VADGLPADQLIALEEEPRIDFVLDQPGAGPVIGFIARQPEQLDVPALSASAVWETPRFDVPALGLTLTSVGEILLAVRARFAEGEPTAGAMHFHTAIGTVTPDGEPIRDFDTAAAQWRLALETGETAALFGLGYTLVEAGRPREAYDYLRRYTELTPHNAWAWCWLGQACFATGDLAEARAAFERALACEAEGSFATDAGERLAQLRR